MGGSRRWHGRRRRGAPSSPDAVEVQHLLDDVQRLRLTLTADLAAAASAVEAEEFAIARDIVTGDSLEVRRLRHDVKARNRPVTEPAPARPRRALLVLPAIPLVGALAMTGAAAFGDGGSDHASPAVSSTHATVSTPGPNLTPGEIRETAASTLQQLERVVHQHSRGAQVVAVANHLHDQISAIIARSPHDARSLGEVTRLLQVEQRLLESHTGAATAKALAASRELTQLLRIKALPKATPTTLPSILPTPHHTSSATPKHSSTATPNPTNTSTSAPNPFPTAKSSPTHSKHHHGHHAHKQQPLFGSGLFDTTL